MALNDNNDSLDPVVEEKLRDKAVELSSASQTAIAIPTTPLRHPRLKFFADQLYKYWLLFGIGFVIGLAYAFPSVGKKNGPIHAEWSIRWGAVCVIFLISGLSLRTRQLAREIVRVRLHLLVQVISLVIIPFVVFGLVTVFKVVKLPVDNMLLSGIIIAASTPTTVSSNVVMTRNASGNEAAALMNAALGNVLGIFVSPALVYLFLRDDNVSGTANGNSTGAQLDYVSVLENLGATVLAPLVVGQIIQSIWPDRVARWRGRLRLNDVNTACLLLLVWSIFSDTFASDSFAMVHATDLIAVLVINPFLYVSFSFLCLFLARLPLPYAPAWITQWRFSREDTVAVMYCGATKTVAMGVPLINVLYNGGNPGVIGVLSTPLLMYHVEQLISGSIEVPILKMWVLKGSERDKLKEEGEAQGIGANERV